jgi:hypothetical protein
LLACIILINGRQPPEASAPSNRCIFRRRVLPVESKLNLSELHQKVPKLRLRVRPRHVDRGVRELAERSPPFSRVAYFRGHTAENWGFHSLARRFRAGVRVQGFNGLPRDGKTQGRTDSSPQHS